jgi:GH24 family phage-related lysozyme (muramidase)
MGAINPTNNTSLIIDEFIQHATAHLTTVSGIVNTLSIYPPLPTPAPGIVNWTGYTIPPASRVTNEIRDRIILNEIIEKPNDGSVQLETDPEINRQFNENKGANEGYKVDPDAGGFTPEVNNLVASNIVVPATLPASLVYADIGLSGATASAAVGSSNYSAGATDGSDDDPFEESDLSGDGRDIPLSYPTFPAPVPTSQGDGGFYSDYSGGATVPLGKLSVKTGGPTITIGTNKGLTREQYLKKLNFADGLTIANVDMSRDWATIATQYISKKEGYTGNATWDVNAYRLGYGTDKILDNGTLRVVRPDKAYHERTKEKEPANGDRTTVEDALKVLEMQIRTTYKDAVVGTGDVKITEADWNALNDRQRAGLVSFVYNCGSFKFATSIPKAIKAKDYIAAANGILNGAITGKNTTTKVVETYEGLIRRRAEEAGIFAYGL